MRRARRGAAGHRPGTRARAARKGEGLGRGAHSDIRTDGRMNAGNVGSTREPFKSNGVPPERQGTAAPTRNPPASPADVVERWGREGPLVRVPTGIAPFDQACRGGLPIPWRVLIVGAPSAGKTLVAVTIADTLARALADVGLCVGVL